MYICVSDLWICIMLTILLDMTTSERNSCLARYISIPSVPRAAAVAASV